MWLDTELGGYVQLAHVAQLIPVGYNDKRAGAVHAMLANGEEAVLETGYASKHEAGEAIRAVLHLARRYDQRGDPGVLVTVQQALEEHRRMAAAAAAMDTRPTSPGPPPLPEAPEANSSFLPAPGKLSEAELGQLETAAEQARAINTDAAAAPSSRSTVADRLRTERWG